ncbi:MAG: polysaccharide deacetylase family protein [Patescibacteria group bacterium]
MKHHGVITLVFDDGYQAVYDEILPLLAFYKVKAVFAIPLEPNNGEIAGEKIAPLQDWIQAAKKYGHEIAAHSVRHVDLTELTHDDLMEELSQPARVLSAKTIVYPGGGHNNHVIAEAKKFYSAGRTVMRGLETLPPKNVMQLHTINFTKNNFSVLRANIHALAALVRNKWLIETYHFVSSQPSTLIHSTLVNDLDAHLDFITSLPVSIKTIQEVL